MSNLEDGCGCVVGAINAVMVVFGLIFALTNSHSSSESYDQTKTEYSSPNPAYMPSTQYYTPSQHIDKEQVYRNTTNSFTLDDAYDKGYDNGYEQGCEDGRRGKSHGYGYDDSNDYYDYYETMYCEGYESGYDEGFSSGNSEYVDNEEDE